MNDKYELSTPLLERLIEVLLSRQTVLGEGDEDYNDDEVIEIYERLSQELFNQGWNLDD